MAAKNHLRGSSSRWTSKLAFTLIELLVVVAIIGLLIGLLIPQLSEVREKARQAKCAANYHTMGQVFYTYANDYEGNLFCLNPNIYVNTFQFHSLGGWPYGTSTSPGTLEKLTTFINPYTSSLKFMDCPSLPSAPPLESLTINSNLCMSQVMLLFNFYHASGPSFPVGRYNYALGFPRKLSEAPSSLPMAQDAYEIRRNSTPYWVITHSRNGSYSDTTPGFAYFPTNLVANESDGLGTTILYYDGSARFVPRNELVRVDINYNQPAAGQTWITYSTLP